MGFLTHKNPVVKKVAGVMLSNKSLGKAHTETQKKIVDISA